MDSTVKGDSDEERQETKSEQLHLRITPTSDGSEDYLNEFIKRLSVLGNIENLEIEEICGRSSVDILIRDKTAFDYIKAYEARERAKEIESKEDSLETFVTSDELELRLIQKGGELRVELNEGLASERDKKIIDSLEDCIGSLMDVDKKEVIEGFTFSGDEKKIIKMNIKGFRRLSGLELLRTRKSQFYDKMECVFEKRIEEINNEERPITKRAITSSMLDDIEYWTHLSLLDIKRGDREAGSCGLEYAYKLQRKLLETADFMRELYGLVELNSGITRRDICSDGKSENLAKQRHIMMYIARYRFSFLGSVSLGIMFGNIGKPKNHATVLLAEKSFDEKAGRIRVKDYQKYGAKKLYADAITKYEAAHKNKK
jgi:hypothetical protein